MNPFNYLYVADLSRIGSAYVLINQFVDNESVRLLEISPCGSEAQIVLTFNDSIVAQLVFSEAHSLLADAIYKSSLIKVESKELIETFLHQNKPITKKHLLFSQSTYLSDALSFSNLAITKGISLLEIRTIRTQPKSCQVVVTSDSIENLVSLKNNTAFCEMQFDLIDNAKNSVKDLFEIRK